MKIDFDLTKSNYDSCEYYGSLILKADTNEIKIKIRVIKGDKNLFVSFPSKKSEKDDKYYSDVFVDKDLYEEINKVLNKKYK